MKQHILLVGQTGSGKTTDIRTISKSVMNVGGGYCFIDGKADTIDTYLVLYKLVAECGRLEDLYVLNFLNPKQSHTFNFMLYGDSDFLSEVLASFLPDVQGDATYWQERGKSMMNGLLACLVFMRDHPEIFPDFVLNIETVRSYMPLARLIELMNDERIPFYHQGRPVKVRLKMYLDELGPNWQDLASQDQKRPDASRAITAGEIARQHGFCMQQWTAVLDRIGGAFYNIFVTDDPDIDLVDVVTNSRILIVLLPSLRYSPSTMKALGKMILGCYKVVFDTLLGKDVVGEEEEIKEEVYRKRPALPFLIIADEYGSYAVEGIDVVAAQARSLGVCLLFSVQELASMKKASEIEMNRLLANTIIKIVKKMEDHETTKFFVDRIGEKFVLVPNLRMSDGLIVSRLGNYDGTFHYTRMPRVDPRDLHNLKVGEGFIIYGDEVRKFRTPYERGKGKVRLFLNNYVSRVGFDNLLRFVRKDTVFNSVVKKVYEDVRRYSLDFFSESLYRKAKKAAVLWAASAGSPVGRQKVLLQVPDEVLRRLGFSDDDISKLRKVSENRRKWEETFRLMYERMRSDRKFQGVLADLSESFSGYLREVVRSASSSSTG